MASVLAPPDKNSVVYTGHLLMGLGCLIPWNAFISAADYFEARYPGKHADRLFSVCYLPTQLVTLLVMMRYHAKLNTQLRICWSFAGFSAIMALVPVLEATTSTQGTFYGIVMFVVATGVLDGIAQGALYGDVTALPPLITQAIVTGTAVSGTAVSLLRIVTKAAFTDSLSGLQLGAYLYFVLAAIVCLLCVLVYAVVLPRQPIVQHARLQAGARNSRTPASDTADADAVLNMQLELGNIRSNELRRSPEEAHDAVTDVEQEHGLLEDGGGAAQPASLAHVVEHSWPIYASLVIIYTTTLAIFPGFLVEDITSAELGSCGARLAFVPLFFMTARVGAGPIVMALLTLALGVSNGYLTAIAMMRAPAGLQSVEAELAGHLSVVALIVGLCLGALCSFLWLV